jgi:hypothetical protein
VTAIEARLALHEGAVTVVQELHTYTAYVRAGHGEDVGLAIAIGISCHQAGQVIRPNGDGRGEAGQIACFQGFHLKAVRRLATCHRIGRSILGPELADE